MLLLLLLFFTEYGNQSLRYLQFEKYVHHSEAGMSLQLIHMHTSNARNART